MNEWLLLLLLTASVVSIAVVLPLRKTPFVASCVGLCTLGLALTGYWLWGGYPKWHAFLVKNQKTAQAKELLKSIGSTDALITKLRTKLDDTPKSAKGWYLLGKLYLREDKLKDAVSCFEKSYQFKPSSELYAVTYGQGLWQLNQYQFNPSVLAVFHKLIKENPNQPDALAMLAMEAYQRDDFAKALFYWQALLQLVPDNSEEAKAIRKAIAKASGKAQKRGV